MFCPNCGYNNKNENKFCLKCGKKFVPQKQTKKQQNTNYDPKAEDEKIKAQALESAVQAMSLGTLQAYESAFDILNTISGWKNADDLKKQCEEKIEELHREKLILKKKRIKLAVLISAPIAVLLIIAVIVGILITPKLKYDEAMGLLDNADYASAKEIFEEIRDYKDSEIALTYISVMNSDITDYDEKIKILESLGDYRDSAKVLLDLKYEKAAEYAANENYQEAVELIDSLGDYGDPDDIKQNIYKTAVDYFDDRKFSEAAEIFLILGKYQDSEEYIEKIYAQAGVWFNDKKYNYAAAVYMSLGDYSESKDKVEELYKKCLDYIAKEKYTDAVPILKNLKDYKGSESKLEDIYNMTVKLVEDKKYDEAIKILEKFGKYKDSESLLNEATELQNKEKYDKALKLGNDGKYDEAIKIFEELGDYSDSKSQISEMKKKRDADTYEMKGTTAWVVIDNGYLNVRKTANSDAASVGKLYNGDEVTIQATNSNGKWYKVTSGDITGYCSVDYISLIEPIESSMFDISGEWHQVGGIYSMTVTKDDNNYKVIIEYEVSGSYRSYCKIRFTAKPNGSNNSYSYQLGRYEERNSKEDITPVYTCFVNGNLTYSDGNLLWDCYYADSGEVFENNINIQFEKY